MGGFKDDGHGIRMQWVRPQYRGGYSHGGPHQLMLDVTPRAGTSLPVRVKRLVAIGAIG